MMVGLLSLAFTGFVFGLMAHIGGTQGLCLNSNGLFPDPEDCNRFYHCWNGNAYHQSCPSGLYFNPACSCCDWPQNVDCGGGAPTTTTTTASPTTTEGPTNPTTTTESTTTMETTTNGGGGCSEKKMVCYYPNWPYYRQGIGKYTIDDIDVSLCTHVIYSFATLDPSTLTMKVFDDWLDIQLKNYVKFVALKQTNPNVKFLIALGGWNDSRNNKYSTLLASDAKIANFVTKAVQFLKDYGFDGLDLDYEYPTYDGVQSDRNGFTKWIKALKTAFEPHGYELTAAVSAGESTIKSGYDIPQISKYLDAIHLMAYDMHGSWEASAADHHAPLYRRSWDTTNMNIDYAVKLWIDSGCPKEKLILGIPTYGKSWTLTSSQTQPPAPANGAAQPGPITKAAGSLSYMEICMKIKNNGWTEVEDPEGPYAYGDGQWVGYDTPTSAAAKADYINNMGLGGAMFWDLPSDDFSNQCGKGKYPIISKVNGKLRGGSC